MEKPSLFVSIKELATQKLGYQRFENGQSPLKIQQDYIKGDGRIENPYLIQVKIKNDANMSWTGIIKLEHQFNADDANYYMPAYMYGKNRGDAPIDVVNLFPRIRNEKTTIPVSNWWMTRSDRLSNPVTIATTKNDMLFGIIGTPYVVEHGENIVGWNPKMKKVNFVQYTGYSCAFNDDNKSIGYTIGYENAPYFFKRADIVEENNTIDLQNCITLKPNQAITVQLQLIMCHKQSNFDVHKAIKKSYYEFHQLPRRAANVSETVASISEAIYRDAYIPDKRQYAGMVSDTGEMNVIPSFSWTNGMPVAVSMLISGIRLQNQKIREQALHAIKYLLRSEGLNSDNGLPFDSWNEHGQGTVRGWWFDQTINRGHSGYLIGQGIYYLLKGYQYEKSLNNIVHPDWLEYASDVINQLVKGVNADSEFPYVYSEHSAAGVEYDSLGSCWVAVAIAYYENITGDEKFLDILINSESHYYHSYVEKLECYGGPLDTSKSPDNEGILAYIRLVKILHELTDDDNLLNHMQFGLYQEFSYKFAYNSPIKVDPLKRLGWSSAGGSVTSVCNPHIHPMSSTIIDEIKYYFDRTHDKYAYDRMMDTLIWGKQSFNRFDGEFDFGKIGWMSERFCYSQGLLTQTYNDGSPASTWFNLLPWAATSVLEGYTGTGWNMRQVIDTFYSSN